MIGKTIAHYQVTEKLGEGGMGVVYKALDMHLDRSVAIKVLPQDKVADPERKHRFVQEAKAASALNHPNIVTIYDIDEADGVHFIAMEYVAGKTLHEMIQGKGLRLSQSLDYTAQIADALSKAHSAGIVHRDLKPSNVMVTSAGLVKVLDFGLAKLTGWQAAPSTTEEEITRSFEQVTGAGTILGTLSYMSPEQARGREIDHRADIFSLGVVLYHMVTGELPFRGPNAVDVLDGLLHSPAPSLRAVHPDLPEALERTVAHAMAKDPGDRYQSMQELASDLRSLSGSPEPVRALLSDIEPAVTAVPPKRKERWRPGRRSAALAAAVAVLALLLVLPFRERLSHWLGGPSLPALIRLAVIPFNNVGADPENQAVCDGLMEILTTKFNQVEQFQSTLSVVPASEVRTEKVTSAFRARRAFGANLALTGSVQKFRDRVLLTINLVDTTTLQQIDGKVCNASTGELIGLEDDAFNKAVAMLELKLNPGARQVLSAGATKVAAAYNSYLQAVGYMARFDIAENVDKAIQLFQQAVREDPQYALAHAGLGEGYWRKYERTKERKWADAALSSSIRAAEIDTRVARVHVTLGIVYTGIGQPEKAVNELDHAITMEPRSADAYRELGSTYEAMSKTDEAEATYRKAIQLQPYSWSCYSDLGVFYYRRGRYGEAATQFLEVIRLAPDSFRAYSNLGGIYLLEGKFDKAAEMFRTSLAIKPTPQAYSNLASSYILQGRTSEAVPLLEKVTGIGTARYEVWGNLADAYSETPGLSAKAPAAYTRAVELVTQQLAVNSRNGLDRANLAYYLINLGHKKRALEEIERARKLAPREVNVLFRSALVYESAGDREKALKALASAAAGGYSLAVIRAVSDLGELRKDPRYRDLVEGQSLR